MKSKFVFITFAAGALLLAGLAEILYRVFREKLRPPPLWTLDFRPERSSENTVDITGDYFDELNKAQEFMLSSDDVDFFKQNGYVIIRQGLQ